MTVAPWSAKETLRLAKLQAYNILDTPAEPAYDDIVALAAQLCQVPAALISMIDADRQWFKAKVGLEGSETSRSVAFCAHTIQQTEVLVVEDTHLSERFRLNPLVTGPPHIRFYAGMPLITPDGYAVGSLCVADYQPRQLSGAQLNALRVLARQVVAQMELAHQSQQLMQSNEQLEAKVQARTAGLTSALQRLLKAQSSLAKQEAAFRHSSLHDSLTGLPNRSYFMQRLHQAIQLSCRQPSHLYAVLFIDLDHFKPVNDTLGHEIGDRLLRHVAQQIQHLLRKSDLVARLGGDEFAVLLDDIPDEAHAIAAVKRLQTQLRSPFTLNNDRKIYISASIGLTFSSMGYRQPEAALRDADTAMYHAKELTKQRAQAELHLQKQQSSSLKSPILIQEPIPLAGQQFAVFDTVMKGRAQARRTLEDELRQAVIGNQFQLYYQPIFNLPMQTLVGFEALLRWHHPDKGPLEAQEFIAIAEEIGIVRQFYPKILHTACAQLKAWKALQPSLVMHLNLSLLQMRNVQIMTQWQSILTQYQLSAQDFQIEINEPVVLSCDPAITGTLKAAKQAGFGLCVDDFGRGQSSLRGLLQLSINTLKIDRTVLREARPNSDSDMVKTIADLGRSAGINVIAEGIETPQHLAHALAVGCPCGQGFWLSEPLTAKAVLAQLQQAKF